MPLTWNFPKFFQLEFPQVSIGRQLANLCTFCKFWIVTAIYALFSNFSLPTVFRVASYIFGFLCRLTLVITKKYH